MRHQDEHNPDGKPPVLRITRAPAGEVPDPADAPFAVESMAALTHELGNLLDGSMRCLNMARRALEPLAATVRDDHLERVRKQIETVYGSLERMADLIHAAMRGTSSVVGSPNTLPTRPITLGEAIAHAAEVVAPEAAEQHIEIGTAVSTEAGELAAGPIYSVILNGLRNAIESVVRASARRGGRRGGHVQVRATLERAGVGPHPDTRVVRVEVIDDGAGLVPGLEGEKAMELGFSTKPGSLGVGLAISREVVREMAGTIELRAREGTHPPSRPGAVLRIVYPALPRADRKLG